MSSSTGERVESVKHVLRNWMLVSKAHGVANMARNESLILRIIWVFCFMGSFAYCNDNNRISIRKIKCRLSNQLIYVLGIFQVVVTIITFLRFEVTTSFTEIPEAPTLFPAVAVCNLNP